MKTVFPKFILSSLFLLGLSVSAHAATVTIDGIVYQIESGESSYTVIGVESTSIKSAFIPSSINVEDKTYSVNRIYTNAFMGCSSLTEIVFEKDGFTNLNLAYNCFNGCDALSTINFPDVKFEFDDDVFDTCKALEIVICNSSEVPTYRGQSYSSRSFDNVTLYVPSDELVEEYAANNFWGKFGQILPLSISKSTVTMTYCDASFTFLDMEPGHRIVVNLPDTHAVADSEDYDFDESTNTVTIKSEGPVQLNIVSTDDGRTGLSTLTVDDLDVTVNGNILEISGIPADEQVTITTTDGRTIYTGRGRTFKLTGGFYILSTSSASRKVRI